MNRLILKHGLAQLWLCMATIAAMSSIQYVIAQELGQRPNIVYILADDLGWTDTGVYGSKYYLTPNIDRLSAAGLRLTRYYNCQNCQPTRAALMTGQLGPRTGVYTVGSIDRFEWQSRPLRPVDNATQLPLSKRTVAQQLKQAGYVTAMFGKWHLGEQQDYHPRRRGFDEAIVSNGRHFDFETSPPVDVPAGSYLADWLTDRAADFIRRNRSQPFFLYLPHFGVHSPYQAKPELIEKFKQNPGVGGHSNPTYAAMIYSVDESVGRILDLLKELNLEQNTLVVFSSDNGGVGGYVREGLRDSGDTTDNAPLRSGKGSLYEGGIRDPFIVRWPKIITAGSVSTEPAQHVDILPTLVEVAGAKLPDNQPLDGTSLVPIFRNPQAKLPREAIFQHFPGYLGAGKDTWRTTPVGIVHSGDWKLMEFFEDQRLELYNLHDDLGETKNLAREMPEQANKLHKLMLNWRKEIGAPMPTANQSDKKAEQDAPKPKKKKKAKNKKKTAAAQRPANSPN